MNGDRYIHILLINAKTGNEQDFKLLWKSHKFLIDEILLNFFKLYPFLERRRIEIYHFMYSWFWEAVNEHKFATNDLFCYNLKKKIIFKMQKYLKENCQIPKEKIINEDSFRELIKKEKPHRNKKLHYGLKSLTSKQLQAIWYCVYESKKLEESARIIGIKERSLKDRLKTAYKKLSAIIFGIKTKNKKKMFSERLYSLPR
jgi:predicted DNA-binding protein (UPF0251 family)